MLFIFDLDDTLINEGFDDIPGVFLFDETLKVLDYLLLNNHTLAIATHNDNALAQLKKNKLDKYFDVNLVVAFDNISKIPHLKKLINICNDIDIKNFVYIDDLKIHTDEAKLLNIFSYNSSYITGITMKDIQKIFNINI